WCLIFGRVHLATIRLLFKRESYVGTETLRCGRLTDTFFKTTNFRFGLVARPILCKQVLRLVALRRARLPASLVPKIPALAVKAAARRPASRPARLSVRPRHRAAADRSEERRVG